MTGLPAVYRPLNLHNEQPSDLRVHKHFQRFKNFSQACMVFYFIPSILLSFGTMMVRWKWHRMWKVTIQPLLMCLLCFFGFASSIIPIPVSLVMCWKQVYTSLTMLLNLSKKRYCSGRSLEGKDCCLCFQSAGFSSSSAPGRLLFGLHIQWVEKMAIGELALIVQPANLASLWPSDAIGG